MKDEIYKHVSDFLLPFAFNDSVANVFDNMIGRSIPGYSMLQWLLARIAVHSYQPSTIILDLGCATGETLFQIASLNLSGNGPVPFMRGVDFSQGMIDQAIKKCRQIPQAIFDCASIVGYPMPQCSVVLLVFTLQFVPQVERPIILNAIYSALCKGGILLLCEISESGLQHDCFEELHEQFKREHGYSDIEIQQKRRALENVLVPLTDAENCAMMQDAGFESISPFFRCLQFSGWIAQKA